MKKPRVTIPFPFPPSQPFPRGGCYRPRVSSALKSRETVPSLACWKGTPPPNSPATCPFFFSLLASLDLFPLGPLLAPALLLSQRDRRDLWKRAGGREGVYLHQRKAGRVHVVRRGAESDRAGRGTRNGGRAGGREGGRGGLGPYPGSASLHVHRQVCHIFQWGHASAKYPWSCPDGPVRGWGASLTRPPALPPALPGVHLGGNPPGRLRQHPRPARGPSGHGFGERRPRAPVRARTAGRKEKVKNLKFWKRGGKGFSGRGGRGREGIGRIDIES